MPKYPAIPDACWECVLPDCYEGHQNCAKTRSDNGLPLPNLDEAASEIKSHTKITPKAYKDRRDYQRQYQRQYQRNMRRVSLSIKVRRGDLELLNRVAARDGRRLVHELERLLELMADKARKRRE